ncbi:MULTISPECIES: PH domain-containing protein [unclassified Actinopolyspora]|uniref:PH domain-containing protein n=1 Tax=unclassified Actinopolyspora TaxID=2639451 RepID=UPI0013F690A9|nr:PH domain-containing protein [Actinopolyspora sp. BKK2]NHE77331.1 PH domain-containing protein [Actinopolyspora sp. BKK1]
MQQADEAGGAGTGGGLRWSTSPALIGIGWVLACALGLSLLLTGNAVDTTFVAAGALLVASASGCLSHLRPRLRADSAGITVRTLGGQHSWSWERVSLRISRTRRLGRDTPVLELDVPEGDVLGGLLVLGRFDLGTEPTEVAEQLERLRRQLPPE